MYKKGLKLVENIIIYKKKENWVNYMWG